MIINILLYIFFYKCINILYYIIYLINKVITNKDKPPEICQKLQQKPAKNPTKNLPKTPLSFA
jgi:hypothetical protein